MTDDIVARLRHGPPLNIGSLCMEAAYEIERLRSALAIASGMLSTLPMYADRHPQTVMEEFLAEADCE